jgi:hypothetical protein
VDGSPFRLGRSLADLIDTSARVRLTGQVTPGLRREELARELARWLRRSPAELQDLLEHGGVLEAGCSPGDAQALQLRLHRLGAESQVEFVDEPERQAPDPDYEDFDPGLMHCPACGHAQTVSDRCESCGVRFEDYNRQRRSVPGAASSPPKRPASPADWQSGWDYEAAGGEADEDVCLTLFVGPDAQRYLETFERYRRDGRLRFAWGWNWGAVPSPFLWALYRRLWGWALVLGLLEVVVPLGFVVLGAHLPGAAYLVPTGYAVTAALRLVWPAVADFIYLRHARRTLERLDRMSATRMHESEIVTAGGVSAPAVLLGIALSLAYGLFVANLAEVLGEPVIARSTAPAPGAGAGMRLDAAGTRENLYNDPGGTTRTRLRTVDARLSRWMGAQLAAGAPIEADPAAVWRALGIEPAERLDGWGSLVRLRLRPGGYELRSAGPDREFDTADDIALRRRPSG